MLVEEHVLLDVPLQLPAAGVGEGRGFGSGDEEVLGLQGAAVRDLNVVLARGDAAADGAGLR